MSTNLYWVAVIATTIISAARLTRLAVYDKFPPVAWVRDKYLDATDGSGWGLLALCGFCMSFWVTAAVMGWGYFAQVYGDGRATVDHPIAFMIWWAVNGTFAMSYLAATYIANDGDDGEED